MSSSVSSIARVALRQIAMYTCCVLLKHDITPFRYLFPTLACLATQPLEEYERGKIADVLHSVTYKDGEEIITQGDEGDALYFLDSGEAVAIKDGEEGPAVRNWHVWRRDLTRFRRCSLHILAVWTIFRRAGLDVEPTASSYCGC